MDSSEHDSPLDDHPNTSTHGVSNESSGEPTASNVGFSTACLDTTVTGAGSGTTNLAATNEAPSPGNQGIAQHSSHDAQLEEHFVGQPRPAANESTQSSIELSAASVPTTSRDGLGEASIASPPAGPASGISSGAIQSAATSVSAAAGQSHAG